MANILTTGCHRAMASQELPDTAGLLGELEASKDPTSKELLLRAADEIARLRTELSFYEQAFSRMQASQYATNRVKRSLEPSPFAQALAAALGRNDLG